MIMHYGDCKHTIEKLIHEIEQWKLQISIKDEIIDELRTKNKKLRENIESMRIKRAKKD